MLRNVRTISFVVGVVAPLVFNSNVWAQAHATYSGTGDDVVEISKPDEELPALLVVTGNRKGRHFAVVARDDAGTRIGALVNTTEPYDGIVPIDLPPRTNTTLLEISATGSWSIQLYSIGAAQKAEVPGTFEGEGDNVLWIEGEPSRAKIQGNTASRHFAVTAYDGNGNRLGAKVNTADPYSGSVIIPSETLLLQINAVGKWSVGLR
jgi:hypothetical protein